MLPRGRRRRGTVVDPPGTDASPAGSRGESSTGRYARLPVCKALPGPALYQRARPFLSAATAELSHKTSGTDGSIRPTFVDRISALQPRRTH